MKRMTTLWFGGLALVLALLGLAATLPAQAAPQYGNDLVNATVTFHTTDDDKDGDTVVSATLIANNYQMAGLSGLTGHFNDNSDNGPYGMQVYGTSYPNELQHGQLLVQIRPNGNDTWHFATTLTLQYRDGSRQVWNWGQVSLDQDNTWITLTY